MIGFKKAQRYVIFATKYDIFKIVVFVYESRRSSASKAFGLYRFSAERINGNYIL